MIEVIRNLAGEKTRGIYLYRAFDEPPTFHSYDELYRRVAGSVEHFRRQGVTSGVRVLLPFDTSIDVIASLLALIALNALTFSVKPLDARSAKGALPYLQLVSRRFRVTHAACMADAVASELGLHALAPALMDECQPIEFASASPTDVAFVQFSSGSTSAPKGIPVTRERLVMHLEMLTKFDRRSQGDVYVSWLPLYHDMGLILGLLTSVYARNDLHLAAPFQFIRNPTGWLDILSSSGATHTATPYFGVNYVLDHLRREPEAVNGSWHFGRLRCFLIGSDPTNYDKTMAFQQLLEPLGFRDVALCPAYGMAEAVLVVSHTDLDKRPWAHTVADGRKFVATGALLPGFEARLTRDDGSVCAPGELGQIELRAGTMAEHYFEEPAIRFLNDAGYFETGDLAYEVHGELVIAGRAGDRIKVNGQTMFASDFEFAAQTLPFVKHGRVVAFQLDERIFVMAQVANDRTSSKTLEWRQEISTAIARDLGVKIPISQIYFLAQGIEKTTSGKLKRRAMAQAFLDGRLRFYTESAKQSAGEGRALAQPQ